MNRLKGGLGIPALRDPRWLVALFLFGYALIPMAKAFYTQTPGQLAAIIVTCVGLDVLLNFWFFQKWIFPLSAFITALAAFVFVGASSALVYAAVGALAILSKHFVAVDNRHIFNPSNFALTVLWIFLPGYAVIDPLNRWEGSPWFTLLMGGIGLLIVYRAKRLVLSVSYIAAFFAMSLLQSWTTGETFLMLAAPASGEFFQYCAFYMIADPATTPAKTKNQIYFGVLLGGLEKVLRFSQVQQAALFSLFIVCAFYTLRRENREARLP